MLLRIRNWRCIEDLSLDLSLINVFIGRNSTGKSSVAYAIYFFSKLSKKYDISLLSKNLYGLPIKELARFDGTKRYFPIEINIGDDYFCYDHNNSSNIIIPEKSPWVESYLLPSKRIGLFEAANFINKFLKETPRDMLSTMGWMLDIVRKILTETPLLPPLPMFLGDYVRAIHGLIEQPAIRYSEDVGNLFIFRSPLIWMVEYYIEDPFLPGVRSSIESAPEGALDILLIRPLIDRIPNNSLVVIEEPENNKNPLLQIKLVKHMAKTSLEKNITLVMTTHSEIILLTLTKLVEEKILKPEHIRIYYLLRTKEDPWTQAKQIKIYEDGSMDTIPDSQEATMQLF